MVVFFGNLVDWLDFLQGFFGNASFELGTEVSSFSLTHLVLFRVGTPQKPALFINKALAPFRGATSMVVQAPESVVDGTLEFFSSSTDRLSNRHRLIRYSNRLVPFEASFHHAAPVIASTFAGVLIAEMHFDAGDMFRKVSELASHCCFGMLGQLFAMRHVIVCVDLDFHSRFYFR
jgi:hypothetical protein